MCATEASLHEGSGIAESEWAGQIARFLWLRPPEMSFVGSGFGTGSVKQGPVKCPFKVQLCPFGHPRRASVGAVRMFVAVVPPQSAVQHLAEFLEPRREAEPGFRWTDVHQWHLTLAFMAQVSDRHLDDLAARLERAAARRTPFEVTLAGGGAFPNPARAKVLFAGVDTDSVELGRLATGARAAATRAGAAVDGARFHPHVTLARTGRPVEVTRWLRVLGAYRGPTWVAEEITLVVSHLGEGPRRRPRYEVVETFALAGRSPRVDP